MPLTTGRKAIRFKTLGAMRKALEEDRQYQHRHMVLKYVADSCDPYFTRKEVSERTGVPINAMSKVINTLRHEGALMDLGKVHCPVTGMLSNSFAFSTYFKGPY